MEMEFAERNREEYVRALEVERKKMLAFERELPLSLQLVTQAIESCSQPRFGSEEVVTSEGPVLEEFIPLRPSCSSSGEENGKGSPAADEKKPDWLKSVQLWNQEPEPVQRGEVRKPIAVNAKRAGGAFHPFEREKVDKGTVAAPVSAPASSTSENNNNGGEKDKEKEGGQSHRKARRCWSPELHRRFLHALQQLGGSHTATPKQIRELMKVDGLTNDEVKSHLQKYRLHTRRPSTAAAQSSSSTSTQAPQIVLVSGIWVPPPPDYTAAAAAAASAPAQPIADTPNAPSNGVYAPVALLPSELESQKQQWRKQQHNRSPNGPLDCKDMHNRDDNSNDEARTNSTSSVTSSSSQTTTVSPPL